MVCSHCMRIECVWLDSVETHRIGWVCHLACASNCRWVFRPPPDSHFQTVHCLIAKQSSQITTLSPFRSVDPIFRTCSSVSSFTWHVSNGHKKNHRGGSAFDKQRRQHRPQTTSTPSVVLIEFCIAHTSHKHDEGCPVISPAACSPSSWI